MPLSNNFFSLFSFRNKNEIDWKKAKLWLKINFNSNFDEKFCLFQIGGKPFTVQVIDSVADYLALMKEIFDFAKIKSLIQGSSSRPPFKLLINSMHGGLSGFFFFGSMIKVHFIFEESLRGNYHNAKNDHSYSLKFRRRYRLKLYAF